MRVSMQPVYDRLDTIEIQTMSYYRSQTARQDPIGILLQVFYYFYNKNIALTPDIECCLRTKTWRK